jgi:hypothetical protein
MDGKPTSGSQARRGAHRRWFSIVASVCVAAAASGTPVSAAQGSGFEPGVAVGTTTGAADSPSGLQVELSLASEGEPGGELSRTALTLPRGLSLDPSAFAALVGCSPAQIGLTSAPGMLPVVFDADPADCPAASRLGGVEVESSLYNRPLTGSAYLAAQGQNPFGSLLALYVVVEEPEAAVRLKLAGRVMLDAQTGQIVVALEEIPPLEFERATLDIPSGPSALLTTPPTCGSYAVEAELADGKGGEAHLSSHFEVTEGAGGSACPASEAAAPHHPGFAAGTLTPAAGAYSPFFMHLSREDGSQRIGALNVTLPPGLLGKLGGIAECSDVQIEAAERLGGVGEGVLERQSPSCPPSAQIGTITVGVGSGDPLYAQGRVYLAGPYKGAPLSVVAITPAIAGPLDLGVTVDRVATYVNPITAQINPVTEKIPTVLHGIPLDIRSIAVALGREQFILNPTNCSPFVTAGLATSTLGLAAPISSPFQANGCSALPFRPKLRLRLKGATRRGRFPALTAVLTTKPGEANSASGRVTLPRSEFVEQGHFHTVCTRVQFAVHQCPSNSIYGHAKVFTPLLEVPEEGPVYMRSSDHLLPDLVVALKGPAFQPIEIDLDSRIDSVHGRLRSTFEVLPDAPVSRFVLKMEGGKRGLLVNSEDLCAPKARTHATIDLTGQNGKAYDTTALVGNSCRKAKHHRRAHKLHRRS